MMMMTRIVLQVLCYFCHPKQLVRGAFNLFRPPLNGIGGLVKINETRGVSMKARIVLQALCYKTTGAFNLNTPTYKRTPYQATTFEVSFIFY
jgi:hypothetical protein